MSTWVKCEEKLPDPGVDVLVRGISGWFDVKHLVACTGRTSNGTEYTSLSWYPGGCPAVNTSHWMYIPEIET
jgi:hypothetical protein